MSLTGHLDDKNSPIGAFLRTRFPNTRKLAAKSTPICAQRSPYSLPTSPHKTIRMRGLGMPSTFVFATLSL
jgi:hypothetical protein